MLKIQLRSSTTLSKTIANISPHIAFLLSLFSRFRYTQIKILAGRRSCETQRVGSLGLERPCNNNRRPSLFSGHLDPVDLAGNVASACKQNTRNRKQRHASRRKERRSAGRAITARHRNARMTEKPPRSHPPADSRGGFLIGKGIPVIPIPPNQTKTRKRQFSSAAANVRECPVALHIGTGRTPCFRTSRAPR